MRTLETKLALLKQNLRSKSENNTKKGYQKENE